MNEADLHDIQAALDGDEEAFARLVDRYEPQVARLMWRFTRRPAECEELVQDVFVEAFLSLHRYRARAPFLHWLRRIGTRVGYRFWKRRAREKTRVPLGDMDPVADDQPRDGPTAAAELLHALLARLRPPERLVLTLEYFEQCSLKQIAQRTGWSVPVVKMRAHRAPKRLRALMERENLTEKLQWTR